jgi:hypothetical protein
MCLIFLIRAYTKHRFNEFDAIPRYIDIVMLGGKPAEGR